VQGSPRYSCISLSWPKIRETGLPVNIGGLTSGHDKDQTSLERAGRSPSTSSQAC
jgi:hypothetical protein